MAKPFYKDEAMRKGISLDEPVDLSRRDIYGPRFFFNPGQISHAKVSVGLQILVDALVHAGAAPQPEVVSRFGYEVKWQSSENPAERLILRHRWYGSEKGLAELHIWECGRPTITRYRLSSKDALEKMIRTIRSFCRTRT